MEKRGKVIILIVAIVFIGLIMLFLPSKGYIECGENESCYEEALINCERAKILIDEPAVEGGMVELEEGEGEIYSMPLPAFKYENKILGEDKEDCVFEVFMIEHEDPRIKGKTILCHFDRKQLEVEDIDEFEMYFYNNINELCELKE